jgi:hypothetical protein
MRVLEMVLITASSGNSTISTRSSALEKHKYAYVIGKILGQYIKLHYNCLLHTFIWLAVCESVRRCVVMMEQPVLLSPSGQSLCTFSRTCRKTSTVVCGIDRLACEEFFVNSPLDVDENDEHALDFVFHLSHLSRSRWVWTYNLNIPYNDL